MRLNEDWVEPGEIVTKEFNSLRGRMCALIESVGLPTRQEKAFKTLLKNITYQQEDLIGELIGVLNERGAKFKYREGRLSRNDH